MEPQESERVIRCEVTVPASVNEVWHAWATEEGIVTFFAPACNVELRVDGPYEIFFNPEAEPGQRGAEGMRVTESLRSGCWLSAGMRPHICLRFEDSSRT